MGSLIIVDATQADKHICRACMRNIAHYENNLDDSIE